MKPDIIVMRHAISGAHYFLAKGQPEQALAEISRAQVWQWIRHTSRLSDGSSVTPDLVREIADDEVAKIRERLGEDLWAKGRFKEARGVFEEVALSRDFPAFLTLAALKLID